MARVNHLPSHDHARAHAHAHHHTAASKGQKTKVMSVYLWQCHICGLDGMEAVTQMQCANCVHVRCPDCLVEATPVSD
ncbi:hypothetical protein SPBR_01130 [Sporothrix brasiliensis 5110]|uniref:Uncharacterized protein n=1 Tax=Sporothrix brasiliensis 5110 TaxID=1398154 RepID=A0A0C2ETW4_9PEZI|nr:uncharacterized protein SPBR_01130 [Sporothrix brasiliensis 5110]KIH89969.1 hypothetical protein SPBR_01130 [Sporothrix brasiliensis 5110]